MGSTPPTPTHAHPQPSLGRRDRVEAGEAPLCPQGSGVGLHAQGPNSPSPAVSILQTQTQFQRCMRQSSPSASRAPSRPAVPAPASRGRRSPFAVLASQAGTFSGLTIFFPVFAHGINREVRVGLW